MITLHLTSGTGDKLNVAREMRRGLRVIQEAVDRSDKANVAIPATISAHIKGIRDHTYALLRDSGVIDELLEETAERKEGEGA